MPDSKWLSVKKDNRHYHYVCDHCKSVSKYRKTPYCPMCGYLMLNSETKKEFEAVGGEEYVSKAEFNNYKEDMRRYLKKLRGAPPEKEGESNVK